ncbi:MAG TPA: DEAD/DEAH box helicase family protein [Dehalococcoidia bacterium]|nr:DEAD/DEAH box helicase family protein [Dehalococcoidia bacterium]
MQDNPFQTRAPSVEGNGRLRIPQREAYAELSRFAEQAGADLDREIGIILPVGCGKSGCIALAPFAFKSLRTLVVAPNLAIAHQLQSDLDPSGTDLFYAKCLVLDDGPYPEPAEIRGTTTNRGDLDDADVVVTNIQQLQGTANRWLENLPEDFFDLILFDEGHHNVASSWEALRAKFPGAKIVNFSATPARADGQLMAGRILYSYPVFRAIQEGYVKRLKAVVLNPRTLRYVRREDGNEVEVSLDEVRRLGEDDADFRRSIVTSSETLQTIVDVSIRQLRALRERTGENRLKIIASALNYEHCRQIVQEYRARGLRADYVHSREGPANDHVVEALKNHQLDVIVQVRKLGEGFDHPFLSVAAVFSIFSNLSPFVQFVGRIMRVIEQNSPGHPLNNGVVVFHAGANIARRWDDFREYSEADREYFDQLLPLEGLDFGSGDELEVNPVPSVALEEVDVRSQTEVSLEEIPLIEDDTEAMNALRLLQERGYSSDEVRQAFEELIPVPVTKVRRRQARRYGLDMRVRTQTGQILAKRGVNPESHELDRQRMGRTNFVVLKSAIDRAIFKLIDRSAGERSEFTKDDLDKIDSHFEELVERVTQEVFDGN